jgi:hypothetical protein
MSPYRVPPEKPISLWKPRTFLGFIKRFYRKALIFWFKSWRHRFIRCKFCTKVVPVPLKVGEEYRFDLYFKQRIAVDMHYRTDCPYFKDSANRPSPLPIPMPKIYHE